MRKTMRWSTALGGLVLFFLGAVAPVAGDEILRGAYQKLLRSTAWVIPPRNARLAETGVLVHRAGKLVVTDLMVVGSESLMKVAFPVHANGVLVNQREIYLKDLSHQIPARVVHREPRCGLAVLELDYLPEGVEEVKWATETPQPGDAVHALGNPNWCTGLWVFQTGYVRQVYHRKVTHRGYHLDARVLEVQTPHNQGDSGAPLVNDRGELVGMVEFALDKAQILTVGIEVGELKNAVEKGRETALKLGPRDLSGTLVENLGLNLIKPDETLADQLKLPADRGLLIASVRAGSQGEKVGFLATDILLEIGGQPVANNPALFGSVLVKLKAETPQDAIVLRKAKQLVLKGIVMPPVRIDKP